MGWQSKGHGRVSLCTGFHGKCGERCRAIGGRSGDQPQGRTTGSGPLRFVRPPTVRAYLAPRGRGANLTTDLELDVDVRFCARCERQPDVNTPEIRIVVSLERLPVRVLQRPKTVSACGVQDTHEWAPIPDAGKKGAERESSAVRQFVGRGIIHHEKWDCVRVGLGFVEVHRQSTRIFAAASRDSKVSAVHVSGRRGRRTMDTNGRGPGPGWTQIKNRFTRVAVPAAGGRSHQGEANHQSGCREHLPRRLRGAGTTLRMLAN